MLRTPCPNCDMVWDRCPMAREKNPKLFINICHLTLPKKIWDIQTNGKIYITRILHQFRTLKYTFDIRSFEMWNLCRPFIFSCMFSWAWQNRDGIYKERSWYWWMNSLDLKYLWILHDWQNVMQKHLGTENIEKCIKRWLS